LKQQKYYVCMIDRFMSGWGKAEGKINKLVIECETYEESIIIHNNAVRRPEMKYININRNKPHYNKDIYYVSMHDKTDYKNWFKENSFKGE